MATLIRRLRSRCGRWLLRPELEDIWRHYNEAAVENNRKGKYDEERNCSYIAIGLRYATEGWAVMATAWPVDLVEVVASKLPTNHRELWAAEILDAIDAAGYNIVPDEPEKPLDEAPWKWEV